MKDTKQLNSRMDRTTICPICDCHQFALLYSLDQGALVTCQECSLVSFFPVPSAEEVQAFYDNSYHESYSQSPMVESSFAVDRYETLTQMLEIYQPTLCQNPQGSLLDVGCGTGDFLKVAQQAGWLVTGTEICQDAVDRAVSKVGDCIRQGDITALTLPPASYNLITSYHVIEHLLNPMEQLQQCYRLLAPNGVFFVETPNIKSLGAQIRGAKWSHIIPPEHLLYFSPASLKYALHKAGFEQVQVFTSAPKTIVSTQRWPAPLQSLARQVYNLAPRFQMGAALQALAFKPAQ